MLCSVIILFLSGCGAIKESQVAKVHQAWNARYQYDLENRRMVSKYENKKIGRVKGRDEWGRVNYDRYWVMRPLRARTYWISIMQNLILIERIDGIVLIVI